MKESNFSQKYLEMGLHDRGDQCYEYIDSYSAVSYTRLQTIKDLIEVPVFAIFTKENVESSTYKYVGTVSADYHFLGNEVLTNSIKESITSTGNVIFGESYQLSPSLTTFRNDIVINSQSTISDIGIIRPQISILNDYKGSSVAKVSFGFSLRDNSFKASSFNFSQKIMTLKQIHIKNSKTIMTGVINGYVNIFSQGITSIIEKNFNTRISDDDALKILDMVEKLGLGKNRTSIINEFIQKIENKSAWNIFHTLIRFATNDKNINVKKLLENVAESVLIIPGELLDTIDSFNKTLKGKENGI